MARTWGLFWPGQMPEGRAEWVTGWAWRCTSLLLPLAVYGFVVLRRRGRRWTDRHVRSCVVILTSLVAYGSVRFRHSAELALVVLAAVALDALWRSRRRAESA